MRVRQGMVRNGRAPSFRLFLTLLLLLVWVAPANAGPKCLGPYTLNSNNYAPDSAGDDVRDWWGDFTINLAVTSGTLTVSVESTLDGGAFASLGSMTTTAIAQFHGPLHRLRFLVTGCSSCLATVIACVAKGE